MYFNVKKMNMYGLNNELLLKEFPVKLDIYSCLSRKSKYYNERCKRKYG